MLFFTIIHNLSYTTLKFIDRGFKIVFLVID